MFCSTCGARSEDDTRFCDRCGADLSRMPRPSSMPPAPPGPPGMLPMTPPVPPVVFPPAQRRAWWYPIGVWVILSGFFLFVDAVPDSEVQWAYWPIGIIGIFLVGFPLLNRLERAGGPRP